MRHSAVRRSAIAAVVLGVVMSTLVATPASAAPLVLAEESFANDATAPGAWLSSSFLPCLTAGTVSTPGSISTCGWAEPAGSGVLHFTNGNSQSAYAILDTPVDTSRGLQITFDMFQYGNGPQWAGGGDGMAFMLIDGSVSPTQPGASGAAIGYGSLPAVPGIEGGYVGVAFDTYGAFSNPGVGTGSGSLGPNSISVRGSEATDYNYITGTVASGSLSNAGWSREDARRSVSIEISSQNIMSVAVDYGAGYVTELQGLDLATINGPGSLPPTLKVGFSAGTGGAWNYQELQNFRMVTLAPDLAVTATPSTIDPATLRGSVDVLVSNDAAAGSTDGTVTVSTAVDPGLTLLAAAGTGWACTVTTLLATCTRPGSGASRLDAAESYPPIRLELVAASAAALPLSVNASVATADDSGTANNAASAALLLGTAAAAPALAALPNANGAEGSLVWAALALLGGGTLLLLRVQVLLRVQATGARRAARR